VYDDAGNHRPAGRMPRGRDGNGDEAARLVDQAMPLGCRLVAENRTGTSAKQRGPKLRLPGRVPGECHVDASVQPLPAAAAHLVAHRIQGDACSCGLTAGDGVGLMLDAWQT